MIDLCAGGIFAAMLGASSPVIWQGINDCAGWVNSSNLGKPGEWDDGQRLSREFCSYSYHRQNYWRDRYIDMLKELTGFESVALFSTGSEATEAFWRCSRVFNGRPGVWGGLVDPDETGTDKPLCDAMHGWTLGAMIMAGKMYWHTLGIFPELGAGRFGMMPDATSCIIMEPYHAPSGQFHKIEPTINTVVAKRKEFPDILFCMDEIQGGFGRTGKLWAHEHYVEDGKFLLSPDFITIGKLCGGGLPLSALLGPKDVMESETVKKDGYLHSTHSGNPLMCAVGCRVIEEMRSQKLIERSAILGESMHEELKKLSVRSHGKGLLAGIELADPNEVQNVVHRCLDRGVMVCDTGRKWVKIGPSLNIEEEILMKGIKILMESVEEVISERQNTPCGDNVEGSEGVDQVLQPVRVLQDQAEASEGSVADGTPRNSENEKQP